MQEFTENYREIQNALHKCWNGRASKGDEKNRLIEARKKVFGDIALGKVTSSKKEIFNDKIRRLEEDIKDLAIMVEELELRHTLLKRSGGHMQEVKEAKNV